MADPYTYRPKSRLPAETKTFTSEDDPDVSFTITLRKPTEGEINRAQDNAETLILEYAGDRELGIKPVKTFPALFDLEGEEIEITWSKQMALICCLLEIMQPPWVKFPERKQVEYFISLKHTFPEDINKELNAWVFTLMKSKSKNSLSGGADTTTSSA